MEHRKQLIGLCVVVGIVWSLAACRPVQPVADSSNAGPPAGETGTPLPEPEAGDGEGSDAEAGDPEPTGELTPQPSEEPPAEEMAEHTATPDPALQEVPPVLTGTVTFTATAPITVPVATTLTPTAPLTTTPTLTPTVVTPTVTPTGMPTDTPPTDTPPAETPTAAPPETPPATPSATAPASPEPPPSPTGSPTVAPTATPLPTAVVVSTHRTFIEGSDRIVVGDVINGSAAPVYNVRVIATFYDAEGDLVGAQESQTLLAETLPRQTNPFRLVLRNAPAAIQRYELSLVWDDIHLLEFERVTVISEELTEAEGHLEIHGELRNDHGQSVTDLQVIATFYDAEGSIVNVYAGTVDSAELEPGATTAYHIQAQFLGAAAYTDYLIQTQGVLAR